MITLYHCFGARSFRPLWMLEELGLPYELKMLPFPPRVLAKEYLAINPLGTIPFMIDGETKMSESSGICHYLTAHGRGAFAVAAGGQQVKDLGSLHRFGGPQETGVAHFCGKQLADLGQPQEAVHLTGISYGNLPYNGSFSRTVVGEIIVGIEDLKQRVVGVVLQAVRF